MNIREYTNIYNNENTHFYYVSVHRLIIDLVVRYALLRRNARILDAGCGTGLLGIKMQHLGNVEGVDIHTKAIKFSRKRGLSVHKASLLKLPFRDNTYDVVTCVDVLYHTQIRDDALALKELYRVLKPGGVLVLRVPALKWLKRSHDTFVHTRERYSKTELNNKLIAAGFDVCKLSFVGAVLVPAALIVGIIDIVSDAVVDSHSGIYTLPKVINDMLIQLLLAESKLLQYMNLSVGIGLIAVAKKPL